MTSTNDKSPVAPRGITSATLARMIFKAEVPEHVVRSLPAQSLYMVLKHNGLASSADLIEMATIEQCRLLLDFDLWRSNEFLEENIWDWLAMEDEEHEITPLQKFLKFVDLKIITLLLSRHVRVVVHDEPADIPPGPGFYTPDRGHTWLFIDQEDSTKHFRLGRLLALIYETNTELFYSLLAIPNVSTDSELEETSLQDRNKRLSAEGIPDFDFAAQLNSARPEKLIAPDLIAAKLEQPIRDVIPIQPLVYEQGFDSNLGALLADLPDKTDLEGELTLIMNAAIIFWKIDFSDAQQLSLLVAKIKGAMNIGIERALRLQPNLPVVDIYKKIGLRGLYSFGLDAILPLRKKARSARTDGLESIALATIDALKLSFPELPAFFSDEHLLDERSEKLPAGNRPITSLKECTEAAAFLDSLQK
jgi:hypothetical protein